MIIFHFHTIILYVLLYTTDDDKQMLCVTTIYDGVTSRQACPLLAKQKIHDMYRLEC